MSPSSPPIETLGSGQSRILLGANPELADHAVPAPGVSTGPVSRMTCTSPDPDIPSCFGPRGQVHPLVTAV